MVTVQSEPKHLSIPDDIARDLDSDWRAAIATPVSPESEEVERTFLIICADYFRPASRQVETTVERFMRLSDQWRRDTVFESSVHEMAMHPAYQKIIGMGDKAVVLILRELEKAPEHWFWALSAITGVSPVRDEDRGDVQAMTRSWLDWGRMEGLL